MKKSNNKGFSLVELIVVVAIMAVLVGVLAPAYLKYVENSRIKKDCNNAEEFRHAVEIALADETVYTSVGLSATKTSVTMDAVDATSIKVTGESSDSALTTAVKAAVGEKIDFVSNKYNNETFTVTISYDAATGNVKVTGESWS